MTTHLTDWATLSWDMLIFSIPFVCAGTCNMIFTKSRILHKLRIPMDNGMVLNGKPLFGSNKTWKGFLGMIVFTVLWLVVCNTFLDLYFKTENMWIFGAALGLGYVLMELPNSLIKRQLNIDPGKTQSYGVGLLFQLIDQLDSVVGCVVVIALFIDITWMEVIAFLIVGTFVHLVVHWMLLLVKLKNYGAATAQ